MKAKLNISEARKSIAARLRPSAEKMDMVGAAALGQIHARFRTAGASGGEPWKPTVTPTGDKPPLAGYEDTFKAFGQAGKVSVESSAPHIVIHQVGATITAKNAPRLFIPLTDKARQAYAANQGAPVVRRVHAGSASLEKPEVRRENLKYGTDYVLVRSVVIPARPMLPTSDAERAVLGKLVAKIIAMPPAAPTTIEAGTAELAEMFGIELLNE